MNIHQNARLTPQGRLLLVERITEAGWSVVQAAQAATLDLLRPGPQPPERPALGVGEAVVGPLPCIIQLLASRQREPATGLWVYIFRIHGFPSTIGPPGRAPRIRQSIGPSGLPMRAM